MPSVVPDVQYARSGDVAIAYQVVGEGPKDLVFVPFLANLHTIWLEPRFARFLRDLATGRRLVVINPRGVGLSDRPRGFTIESRIDDVRAVMDAVGIERAPLLGLAESGATCALFAASYPDRVERLILYTPAARHFEPDRRAEQLAGLQELREAWGRREFLEDFARQLNPQWAADEEFVDWFVWHHRLTTSPGSFVEFQRMILDLDVTDVLPAIRVPTLVLTKERVREQGAGVAALIDGAEFIVVPGEGLAIFENDLPREAIEAFLAGAEQHVIPETVLATVLFTDLVGSTERAVELGDRAWRELLQQHNAAVRRELERYRGVELDTAGDGFFARFEGPARAIACAAAIRKQLSGLDLEIRVGIHTGECERVGEKVAGLAVNVGARVASAAGPGEVLVSSTVKDLVAGSGISFDDRGEHELKGVGAWRLYSVVDA